MSYTVTLFFDNMVDETHLYMSLRKREMLLNARLSLRASIEESDCIESNSKRWNDELKTDVT